MSSIPATGTEPRDPRPELPAPPLRIALLTAAALAAGIGAAWGLSHREQTSFAGRLEARTTFVNADRAGVVTSLLANEGDRVSLDDPLLSLADGELRLQISRMREEVATRTSQRKQAEAQAAVELAWRLKDLDSDIAAMQLKSAEYLKQKFDHELECSMWEDLLTTRDLAMLESVEATGFATILHATRLPGEGRMQAMLRHETAANAVDVSAAQVEICKQRQAELILLKEQLPASERQKAGVDVAIQRQQQAEAELARLEARESELTMSSSAVGTVGVFRKKPGDRLEPGDPIVEILDDASRWLRVEVPSAHITEFTVGRTVELTFPGMQQRRGRIFSIAPQAQTREEAFGPDAIVIVRVAQAGKVWPIVPLGSRVDVNLAE